MVFNILIGVIMTLLLTPLVISGLGAETKLILLYSTGLSLLHAIFYCGFKNIHANTQVAKNFNYRYFMVYLVLGLGVPMLSSLLEFSDSRHIFLTTCVIVGMLFNNHYLVKPFKLTGVAAALLYASAFTFGSYWFLLENLPLLKEYTDLERLTVISSLVFIPFSISSYVIVECLSSKIGANAKA